MAPTDAPIQDAPILVDLRQQLDATGDPAERAALRIRQALYLARTNRMSEAEGLPQDIRTAWAGQEDARVFVWLWILEGVLAFYQTSRTLQRDRLRQAHAVASKAGWRGEAQLAAAWLAHFAYVDSDYGAMTQWLDASGLGEAELVETVARSSLTLACALQLCGEDDRAALWFARAREVARRAGDRAGIMAATANRLLLKLNDNWLAFLFLEPMPHDMPVLRQELLGILGYEQLSGSASLTEQNEVAHLRMAVIRGEDMAALLAARGMAAAHDRRSDASLLLARAVEQWLCARGVDPGRTGPDPGAATEWLERAQAMQESRELDDDDLAGCLALASKSARLAGDPARADALWQQACAARARFVQGVRALQGEVLATEQRAAASWPGA